MKEKRGKQKEKHPAHIKSRETYNYYLNKYCRSFVGKNGKTRKRGIIDRNEYFIEYLDFNKIIDEINLALRHEIIYNTFDLRLPHRMGVIGIRKYNLTPYINKEGKVVNPLPVDWGATWKLWEADEVAKKNKKIVRHYNKHTKGFIVEWVYLKRTANYKNKTVYKFIPCRTAKAKLAEALRDPFSKVDYYLK